MVQASVTHRETGAGISPIQLILFSQFPVCMCVHAHKYHMSNWPQVMSSYANFFIIISKTKIGQINDMINNNGMHKVYLAG